MNRLIACLLLTSTSLALAQPDPHVPPYPRIVNTIGYKLDPSWPKEMPAGGEWDAPMSSVAIGPDGNVWTFNRGKIPVQVYTPDGKLVKYWGQDGLFKNPHTIRFDSSGNLWTADTGTHTVRKFTLDGKVLLTIGTPDEHGEDQTHLNQPNDIAVAPNGDVYISDGYGNDRVIVFDKNGKFLRTWVSSVSPLATAIMSVSRFSIPEASSSRNGKTSSCRGPSRSPRTTSSGCAVRHLRCGPKCSTNRPLWRRLRKDQLFMKLDPEGRLKQLWVIPKGDKTGEVNWIHSIAVAADGSVYFGEVQGKRAEKFVPAGTNASGTLTSSR